jgi:hypothetical protein
VTGQLDARNLRSARVLERLGMRNEAHFVENEFVKGEWRSELAYAMLEGEWRLKGARPRSGERRDGRGGTAGAAMTGRTSGSAENPPETELPLTGGCNCGAVRYEVTEPPVRASYCHYKRCQRRAGAAASAQAHPAPGTFWIVAGQEKRRRWKESGGEKWFCGDCGSAIFGSNPSHPESIGIRMGTFDHDPGVRPTVRQFVAYAAVWEPLPDDGLPRFPKSRHASGTRPI